MSEKEGLIKSIEDSMQSFISSGFSEFFLIISTQENIKERVLQLDSIAYKKSEERGPLLDKLVDECKKEMQQEKKDNRDEFI